MQNRIARTGRESPVELKFKAQPCQTHAADSLTDCFAIPSRLMGRFKNCFHQSR